MGVAGPDSAQQYPNDRRPKHHGAIDGNERTDQLFLQLPPVHQGAAVSGIRLGSCLFGTSLGGAVERRPRLMKAPSTALPHRHPRFPVNNLIPPVPD